MERKFSHRINTQPNADRWRDVWFPFFSVQARFRKQFFTILSRQVNERVSDKAKTFGTQGEAPSRGPPAG